MNTNILATIIFLKTSNVYLFTAFTLKGGEDRRIPLLREVFEAFHHIPINIDIKIDDDELIDKVLISLMEMSIL